MMEVKRNGGQFHPGISGNPAGRPRKGNTWRELLNARLSIEDREGRTTKERIVDYLCMLAEQGDFKAIQIIMERTEGRPDKNFCDSAELIDTIFSSGYMREEEEKINLARLTDAELSEYERLLLKATGREKGEYLLTAGEKIE